MPDGADTKCEGGCKKLIGSPRSEPDQEIAYLRAEALVRANFGVQNPKALTEREFMTLHQQALWLEHWRLMNTAEMLGKLLGG